jgi:signal transduction histidine kinase
MNKHLTSHTERIIEYLSLERFRRIVLFFGLVGLISWGLNVFVQFKAVPTWFYGVYVLFNALIYLAVKRRWLSIGYLKHIYIALHYGIFLAIVLFNSQQFHVIVYWLAIVPLMSLLINGQNRFIEWAVVIGLTILALHFWAAQAEKQRYLVEADTLRFALGGLIFLSCIAAFGYILSQRQRLNYARLYTKNERLSQLEKQLRKQNKKLNQQHEQLIAQHTLIQENAEELDRLNQQLTNWNQDLETEVQVRTQSLQLKNQQLTEYAFVNAHTLRGPLARLLGLCLLLEKEPDQHECRQIIRYVLQSAYEMDDVVRNINHLLDENPNFTREDLAEIISQQNKLLPNE